MAKLIFEQTVTESELNDLIFNPGLLEDICAVRDGKSLRLAAPFRYYVERMPDGRIFVNAFHPYQLKYKSDSESNPASLPDNSGTTKE